MINSSAAWYHWKYSIWVGSYINSSSILHAMFSSECLFSELIWVLMKFIALGGFSIRYLFNPKKTFYQKFGQQFDSLQLSHIDMITAVTKILSQQFQLYAGDILLLFYYVDHIWKNCTFLIFDPLLSLIHSVSFVFLIFVQEGSTEPLCSSITWQLFYHMI